MTTKNWKTRCLGELLHVQNGFAFDSALFSQDKGKPLIRIRDLKSGVSTETRYTGEYDKVFLVRAGDILIGMDGEFRCYIWRGNEALLNQRVCRLCNFSDEIEPEFVNYGINVHLKRIEDSTPYVTVKHLSSKSIRAIEFPYPPKAEQRRILSRIKECMKRVDEIQSDTEQIQVETRALFPAILNETFAGLADSVEATLLEDVADIRGGGSLPKGDSNDGGEKSLLLVKVGDMNIEGNDRVINVAREYLPITKMGRKSVPAGSIIFPKRGGAIATNKKRLLGRPAMIDPNLMAAVAKPERILKEFLYYWSLTLDLTQISNGGVIPQLNRKDLAPLPVPVPSLDEQRVVVESLEMSEEYCAQLRTEFLASVDERAHLREAILRMAFAGEL